MKIKYSISVGLACIILTACGSPNTNTTITSAPKNVIFFLGDGMGMTTMTAARIYSVGEDGALTMDNLPETAFVKTFSNDGQVTDSAPSMAAYMTGVKMNNEVISMSTNTTAIKPTADVNGNLLVNNCGLANGTPVTTLGEIAKSKGMSAGVVTTTRVTHATPATVYSHICHRDLENDIAAALVSGGAGYNTNLGAGLDVVLGGGSDFFKPYVAATLTTATSGKRTDSRDLTSEFIKNGYTFVSDSTGLNNINPTTTTRLVGLFTKSHMSYELDRNTAQEPSLSEMTAKAMDILGKNSKGYFLMVEGGRIDHALHETTGQKALRDTIAFDDAIKTAITKARLSDPTLANTLIVVTADHDHTLVLNGYAKRLGKTTLTEPGVLGLVKNYVTGLAEKDADLMPYTIMGFGNGENRVAGARSVAPALNDIQITGNLYHQEAAIPVAIGSETHGGTDVFLGAIGNGSANFHGTIENKDVFGLIRTASGL